VALLFVTVGLLPVTIIVVVTFAVTIPAMALLPKERYFTAFLVAVIPVMAVAVLWAAVLSGFLHSAPFGLPTGWLASPAWVGGFLAAQAPFTYLARATAPRRLPGQEVLATAYAWGWPVSAAAFVAFGVFPSTLTAFGWLPFVHVGTP
jgi:hypothetical protein